MNTTREITPATPWLDALGRYMTNDDGGPLKAHYARLYRGCTPRYGELRYSDSIAWISATNRWYSLTERDLENGRFQIRDGARYIAATEFLSERGYAPEGASANA